MTTKFTVFFVLLAITMFMVQSSTMDIPNNKVDTKALRDFFNNIDKDGNGKISTTEMRDAGMALTGKDLTDQKIKDILSKNDKDKDDQLNFDEILAMASKVI